MSRTVRRLALLAALIAITAIAASFGGHFPPGQETSSNQASPADSTLRDTVDVVVLESRENRYAGRKLQEMQDVLLPTRQARVTLHDSGRTLPETADLAVTTGPLISYPAPMRSWLMDHIRTGSGVVALRPFTVDSTGSMPQKVSARESKYRYSAKVLGVHYLGMFTADTSEAYIRPESGTHPIVQGITFPSFPTTSSIPRLGTTGPYVDVLLLGRPGGGWRPEQPVMWTHRAGDSRVFTTSLGLADDFQNKAFRQYLTHGVRWALHLSPTSFRELAANQSVLDYMHRYPPRGEQGDSSRYTGPEQAIREFSLADDLSIDLVAAEPTIFQPVHLNFDARGRLWVVQYNQFPHPAGLKVTSYDQHLRAEYDRVPDPPPNHVRGGDKITVLEDTDHNGSFDRARDVITGLNITTAVAVGRGGIWVLSPPHLLFYPDANGDAVPDGPPEVHLRGFGLDDTHAVANSLRWGPDGWLYGGQGSTNHSTISSRATTNVHFKGQAIWRYHPRTHEFEIFAEGGGNTFHVEFDSEGRVYSGTNGTPRGLHFKQGGYYQKRWGKHGPLTNPYAFGYFPHMDHAGREIRFTHGFVVYEGGGLTPKLRDHLIAINPLQNEVYFSRMEPDGSTYRTVDEGMFLETPDGWFRPIDIKTGPGGGIYIADWYDRRLSHANPNDNWHRASGRIYRVQGPGGSPVGAVNLPERLTQELVELLRHDSKWYRQRARRVLGDRRDSAAIPHLKSLVRGRKDHLALEALWALNVTGGLTEEFATDGLVHPNPDVRRWTVRLLGDQERLERAATVDRLVELAENESSVQVRSQLAASAKRLPAEQALPVIEALLGRAEDRDDPHIPLQLWWALESKAEGARDQVLALFEDAEFWREPMVEDVIIERIGRRYAAAGGAQNYEACVRLFALSPDQASDRQLLGGVKEGLLGRSSAELPSDLRQVMQEVEAQMGTSPLVRGVRQGDAKQIAAALDTIRSAEGSMAKRLELVQILGDNVVTDAVPELLGVLGSTRSPALRRTILEALHAYDHSTIGERVVGLYPDQLRDDPAVRSAALELLASREDWAMHLLSAVRDKEIDANEVPIRLVQQMRAWENPKLTAMIREQWPAVRPNTPQETRQRVERVLEVVRSGSGNPSQGGDIYREACGSCHRLFGQGGELGPDLTGYDRDNTEYMVQNVVDPDAAIREGYVQYLVETQDGRRLTGILTERTGQRITIRTLAGQETTLARSQVARMEALSRSIMPENLLKPLSKQEIRDLFAYISSERSPTSSK